ncbi:MarR family transcriptional regulator [Arthrobacter sp. lap29]|uniref:MarR family winged helix-turn-helix transcriptional regulator n=1 Tax=Arthrobacter sp. lap29 TaxID=3056122 RepID=UPI0028F6DE88|nr:MarR family transcriptional regulator [Arthrobacter sp. lap29]
MRHGRAKIDAPETLLAPSELRYLVLAAQREGSRALSRKLSEFKLTVSQSEILLVLDEFGPLTLKSLGELIVCEAGSPSRIVEALVNQDLILRTPNPKDRRAVLLELSSKGTSLLPQLRKVEEEIDTETASLFSLEETQALTASLRRFLGFTASGPVLDRRFEQKRIPIQAPNRVA